MTQEKTHKGLEAIRDYLKGSGRPSRVYKTVVKTERLNGRYKGYTRVIRNMREAIEFVSEDENDVVSDA